ncbi:D-alanyl-D-alanine carboxypeptidase family protein [Phosphitispora sp. TUW77]|uniref:D-alanyl-D-alanine carboxypeptidase family protein n=1 Tax=Phosphitispora sp. TUW77 TaxID=3152361 RepID=UPI003AB27074
MGCRLLWVLFLITCLISPVGAAQQQAEALPQVSGKAAVLMDAISGEILYSYKADVSLPPASTTKILTGIIAIERTKLTDIVTSGKNPTLVIPSAIGLHEGETITMENLLYSLFLKSANDAAVAVAEHIAGSVPGFSELMNKKARELGAVNSNFVNPHGLPDPNHYTTAHDLAVIARYAMRNPVFREFVSTKVKVIPRADDSDIKWLQNSNKLLWRSKEAIGIKTGYTSEAKNCLVAAAAKGDQEMIAVVLGEPGSVVWTDAQNLLDYGFSEYSTKKAKEAGVSVKEVKVTNGTGNVILKTADNFYYTVPNGDNGSITERAVISKDITAPIQKGQVLGKLYFYLSGQELGSVNLVAENEVKIKEIPLAPVNTLLAGGVMLGVFVAWNVNKQRKRRRRFRRRERAWRKNAIR